MTKRWVRGIWALAVAGALTAATDVAGAAVPGTTVIEGTLNSTGGGAAADGTYAMTFAVYPAEQGGTALWQEGPVDVKVKNGQFSHALGSVTPLKPTTLPGGGWLGLKVAQDPELTRRPLHSVTHSLRAGIAEGLDCSGCVTALQLDPSLLGAYAKTSSLSDVAKTGSYTDLKDAPNLAAYAKTANLAQVAVSGSYADLANKPVLPVLGKACGTGLVVSGFKADGTLECVAGGAAGSLPPDGIDEISNGLINNQFVDAVTSPKPVPIPDNNPIGVSDTIDFPDIGIAQKLTVSINITNSDITELRVWLYDPNNVEYVLHNKGGSKGQGLAFTFPVPTQTLTGDLTTWAGKNPKGKWFIKVIDSSFVNNTSDGEIKAWAVQMQTLSNKKIQIKGDLIVDGKILAGGSQWELMQSKDFQICTNTDAPGPCVAKFTKTRTFADAAAYCASLKGDICTDSQTYAARSSWNSLISLAPNWTASFADNDSSLWSGANGGTGDNHPADMHYLTPCCFNYAPTAPTEKNVAGIRLLKVHNTPNKTWDEAVKGCLEVNADLCDKGQYYVLRQNSAVSTSMWASDHSDNDGAVANSAIATSSTNGSYDDPSPSDKYGYACCATQRTSMACPGGGTDVSGVCMAKVENSGQAFTTAANSCASLGARICSFSQTAVLRAAGKVNSSCSWTNSHSDNDGQQAKSVIGNCSDNPSDGEGMGYACCF